MATKKKEDKIKIVDKKKKEIKNKIVDKKIIEDKKKNFDFNEMKDKIINKIKDMDKKKRYIMFSGIVLFILIVITIIILLSTGMFNFGKKEYISWTDYLLDQEIKSIKIQRIIKEQDGFEINKTASVSLNDLKNILRDVETCEIHKIYTFGFGNVNSDRLTIIYDIKGSRYQLEVYYNSVFIDKADEELKKLFNENEYFEENVGFKDMEGSFYFYNLMGFTNDIFDPYFE